MFHVQITLGQMTITMFALNVMNSVNCVLVQIIPLNVPLVQKITSNLEMVVSIDVQRDTLLIMSQAVVYQFKLLTQSTMKNVNNWFNQCIIQV